MKATATIPVLRSFDESKAREFYVDFLGFTVDFEHRFGDTYPLFMQVSRGGCLLRLTEHFGDACPGAAVTINVRDIETLHSELAGKDYRFAKPHLEKTPWGTMEIRLADPFGNRITFSQDVSE
jgi:uncharacterized glyoxalase superfamily protein PhnB